MGGLQSLAFLGHLFFLELTIWLTDRLTKMVVGKWVAFASEKSLSVNWMTRETELIMIYFTEDSFKMFLLAMLAVLERFLKCDEIIMVVVWSWMKNSINFAQQFLIKVTDVNLEGGIRSRQKKLYFYGPRGSFYPSEYQQSLAGRVRYPSYWTTVTT